jgi:hypothetical protein
MGAAQVAKKSAEIDHLRALMKAGTLSQAVAQAAIEQPEWRTAYHRARAAGERGKESGEDHPHAAVGGGRAA